MKRAPKARTSRGDLEACSPRKFLFLGPNAEMPFPIFSREKFHKSKHEKR